MTKPQFYQTYGHSIEITNPEDAEYSEHLVLAYEGGDEFVEEGLDLSTNPFKVGYLILKKGN